MAELTKILLDESEMPTSWYNIVPDLSSPPPPALHPGTHEPAGPEDFAPLFPMALIMQEVSQDRYIEIPEEVQEVYRLWRPSPLFRNCQCVLCSLYIWFAMAARYPLA